MFHDTVDLIFFLVLFTEAILIIFIAISIFFPRWRFWPPGGLGAKFILVWLLTFISIGGLVALAILTWDTYIIKNIFLRIAGVVLFIGGNALAIWGLVELGTYASSGLEYRLVTTGPYRYTRNPQYLGDIIALAGAILLVNSFYFTVASGLGIIIFYMLPYAEEPWLREKYGDEYLEYCRRVPRFIGIPRSKHKTKYGK